jgi:hypothetical protein
MSRHVTRVELTKDEVSLLLICVYDALNSRSIEKRRKELLLLMDKLEHEYLGLSLDEPVK